MNVTKIVVMPPSQKIVLTGNTFDTLSGMAKFTAIGTNPDDSTSDISGTVSWKVEPAASVTKGDVRVRAPGTYTVTAMANTPSGTLAGSAELIAEFNGNILGGGATASDPPKLDGTPSGTVSVAYPIDGAVFPSNFGPITVHITRPAGQELVKLSWKNPGLDLNYYARCETDPQQPGTGCYVTLPLELSSFLVPASVRENVKLTARLASAAGGNLVESNTLSLAWANVPLSGGLYYWTTIPCEPGGTVCAVPGYKAPDPADPRGTAVMRYDFGHANSTMPTESKPTLIYTDQGFPKAVNGVAAFSGSPPAAPGTDTASGQSWGEGRCIGCHAISFDGSLMGFSIGGSYPSSFGLLDIANSTLFTLDPTVSPTAMGVEGLKRYRRGNFASFTTFGPKDQPTDPVLMVNMYRGKLALHSADAALNTLKADLFSSIAESKTDPFWSPQGDYFAFTTYLPADDAQTSKLNGDTKTGGKIWIATADRATGPHDDPRILVDRESGKTSYYPAINHESTLVAFNKSTKAGPATTGYGGPSGDGYDDITARLWVTTPTGAGPWELRRANGDADYANSWPRWSPDSGTFRGQKLHWLAFSSRRPYGLQVNTTAAAAKPQLWFAAVLVGAEFTTDPSYAPVWLPKQNLNQAQPTGNHVPQWVKFAVVIE